MSPSIDPNHTFEYPRIDKASTSTDVLIIQGRSFSTWNARMSPNALSQCSTLSTNMGPAVAKNLLGLHDNVSTDDLHLGFSADSILNPYTFAFGALALSSMPTTM
ncbi:hypothetical protein ACLOJK_038593 [Asimina triloba]